MKAVVLAAGRGERLWPLTESRPKHLLPVAGKPVLERTLEALAQGGVSEIIVVVKFKAETIKRELGTGEHFGSKIQYVAQKAFGGTADALGECREHLKKVDRFVVIYGDDYYSPETLRDFLTKPRDGGDMVMGVAEVEDPSRFGSVEVENQIVSAIHEKAVTTGPGKVNAGIYQLDTSVFSAISETRRSRRGEFELTDSLTLLIRQGRRVRAFSIGKDGWCGLSYPWDLLRANMLALEAQSSNISGKIEEGVRIRGSVDIAPGCVVRSGSYLEGPILLGPRCDVGPNSYIRPYTSLGEDVRIGASCEVKNSVIMDNAKIPHLSYVGDSVIGEGSSLGAGTITANLRFDDAHVGFRVKGRLVDSGRRKLGAVLGENVRTGINVSLMPGVKIGPGAWVGPGAVVAHDVPSGARIKGGLGGDD